MNKRIADPKRITRAVLVLSLLGSGFLDFWAYTLESRHGGAAWMADFEAGTGSAPEQYRVGVVKTAFWMTRHIHLGLRYSFTLLDVAGALIAALVLYGILRRTRAYREAGREMQWFASAAFVMLAQFYMLWLLYYQKQETLPAAGLMSLLLLLWTRTLEDADEGWRQALGAAGIMGLSVALGFVRADDACMMNAGMFAAVLWIYRNELTARRAGMLLTAVAAAGAAAGVQWYMMKVAYPQASYGDTPAMQLKMNLLLHGRLIPFVLFTAPVWWTAAQAARRRFAGDAAGMGALAGALMFTGAWMMLGKIDEVRIFLPFALCLTPLTAQLAMLRVRD